MLAAGACVPPPQQTGPALGPAPLPLDGLAGCEPSDRTCHQRWAGGRSWPPGLLPHRGAHQGPSLCRSHVTSCIGDPHPSRSSTHPVLERPSSGATTSPIATLKAQDPI